mmetsp:Transcript_2239/g.5107  ORF Transcript_2239/g.5107 Transcript_2239/m.5107 type:complete len:202 (+) Transcript_2239:2055-2660(+)
MSSKKTGITSAIQYRQSQEHARFSFSWYEDSRSSFQSWYWTSSNAADRIVLRSWAMQSETSITVRRSYVGVPSRQSIARLRALRTSVFPGVILRCGLFVRLSLTGPISRLSWKSVCPIRWAMFSATIWLALWYVASIALSISARIARARTFLGRIGTFRARCIAIEVVRMFRIWFPRRSPLISSLPRAFSRLSIPRTPPEF